MEHSSVTWPVFHHLVLNAMVKNVHVYEFIHTYMYLCMAYLCICVYVFIYTRILVLSNILSAEKQNSKIQDWHSSLFPRANSLNMSKPP